MLTSTILIIGLIVSGTTGIVGFILGVYKEKYEIAFYLMIVCLAGATYFNTSVGYMNGQKDAMRGKNIYTIEMQYVYSGDSLIRTDTIYIEREKTW